MARGKRQPGAKEIRRQSLDHGKRPQGTTKRPQAITKRRPQTPTRRSKRLEAKRQLKEREDNERQITQENPLPSPSKSNTRSLGPQTLSTRGKPSPLGQGLSRKPKLPEGTADHIAPTNHLPTSQSHLEEVASRQSERHEAEGISYDPVAYWTRNSYWPKEFMERGIETLESRPMKRKTKSTHQSQTLERMKANGIRMESSNLLSRASKDLCNSYLEPHSQIIKSSIFSFDQFSKVLERVQDANESRVQRDVTPWVVPSAENLIICGELKNDYIGEELSALWTRCAPMGSTIPKPDYTAGLLPTAFTADEVSKLENYAQPRKPFRFTPRICFPFLMCEAKSAEIGLGTADRQNAHSAGIAVKAICMLYQEAFGPTSPRVHELYGQVLVFSVSHDHDSVKLYGHFATAEPDLPDGLRIDRYPFDSFSLSIKDGANRYLAYNFVSNIYEKFAPVHRERIKDAVAQLPKPAERTGRIFALSGMSSDELDPQLDSQGLLQGDGNTFRKPGTPASSLPTVEVNRLWKRMERERKESDERLRKMKQQMEQQSKEKDEQMERQNKEKDEQMERQNKEKDERMERQAKQIEELMDLLRAQTTGK